MKVGKIVFNPNLRSMHDIYRQLCDTTAVVTSRKNIMDRDFKAGDIVIHNGSNVRMTVHQVTVAGITTRWFDYQLHLQSGFFAREELYLAQGK